MTERYPAPELRLFSLGGYYHKMYQNLREQLRNERLKITRDKMLADLVATGIGLLVAAGSLLWMAWRVVQRLATLGDLAAFYQILQTSQGMTQSIMQNAGSLYESILFLGDLFDFLALEPSIENVRESPQKTIPLQKDIRFENISFHYPGSEKFVLKNFSMTVPAGKIVALVGENGMGKTTLMKLLCRFYDPDEGNIFWDGTDLRDLSLTELRREITMLFQEYYNYQASARHNIAVSDIEAKPDLADVEAAARAAGADKFVRQLPREYETILGKWFGGEELSVGQWQRIALSRALLRQASLIVLDEPTSSMDAWAETDWLHRIREITNGRTLIMITHRFTTAMQADYIYVMHQSEIVEEGTHEALLALGKRYAESWFEQMHHNDTKAG